MRFGKAFAAVLLASVYPGPVFAGDTPLYQPAPDWVVPASLPGDTDAAGASPVLLYDSQMRFENGLGWTYFDSATKMISPEMLAQNTNLALPWLPDKGDLIIHELSILRDGKKIDRLAEGEKFTVLRREQSLEQRALTGILTASLAIEGLQVGDIVRMRISTTVKDDPLDNNMQFTSGLIAAPVRIGNASLRFSWPENQDFHWKVLASDAKFAQSKADGFTTVTATLPLPKTARNAGGRTDALPASAAGRGIVLFGLGRGIESHGTAIRHGRHDSTGSPVAAEVAAIMKAQSDPATRAAMALQIVQDKVSYLALGMNGGNYIPQAPSRTWEVRYGDCKAKTLLLLAMLHAMDIEAEPVLASVQLDGLLTERLPSASAFDHIFVRATIGDRPLWLDGTGTGTRVEDVYDTPGVRHVLPVRTGGAQITTIILRPPARPSYDITINYDESTSVDLPSVVDATVVMRGYFASILTLAVAQLEAKELRDKSKQLAQSFVGEGQYDKIELLPDPDTATATLKAHGVIQTPWSYDERKYERQLSFLGVSISFDPDRSKAAWSDIPVATDMPDRIRYRTRIKLPGNGDGYIMEGAPDVAMHVAGHDINRSLKLANGIVTGEEIATTSGEEIAPAQIAEEREKADAFSSQMPHIVAPDNAVRYWDIDAENAKTSAQIKAIEAVYSKAIALADEDDTSALQSSASFHSGIGNRKAALSEWNRVLAKEKTAEGYLYRSSLHYSLNDNKAALADVEEARKLDPSSQNAITSLANLKAEAGDLEAATALLDKYIAQGGENKFAYRQSKASMLGEWGDATAALAELDSLAIEKPGNPELLNLMCWIKGTREIALDTALKDCTRAIELSSNSAPALDSRALIWLRMGRNEDALRDLDAVLLQAPGLAASRYTRAIVLTRLGRKDDAAKDLAIARRLVPRIETDYAKKYGLKIGS